ncbi:NAD(P)-binding protein [Hypoxylon trugodes]|uniref:NAD(P)-binding protein n=1 Tax=Hypoxylon trugodes TaxID=326681 RepID=UPI0021968289|nr:NAD(P)-binding protein [Hypoxylon trugodes]KAI1392472.1 NAD(P)-binding protein [Hypoxylon trugodes]
MDITGNAFVTGGASGIGKACCIAFAKEGALGVLVADINLDAAQKTAADITALASNPDFRAVAVHVDVTLEESVRNAIKYAVQYFGRIDYSVHCAGIAMLSYHPTSNAKFDEFKRLLEIHVHGTFLVTSMILSVMKSQEPKPVSASSPDRGVSRGVIVSLGSVCSFLTVPNIMQYTTAKHAVLGIIKSAALENLSLGIRANCVCPTFTDTPMLKQVGQAIPGIDEAAPMSIPMGRLARPEEVSDAVLFLCSPRSSFITGITLPIDGGQSLGNLLPPQNDI